MTEASKRDDDEMRKEQIEARREGKGAGAETGAPIPPAQSGSSAAAGIAKTGSATGKRTYTVKAGDSLSAIAKELYGDAGKWAQIYEANKELIGANPSLIKPGQVLTIP